MQTNRTVNQSNLIFTSQTNGSPLSRLIYSETKKSPDADNVGLTSEDFINLQMQEEEKNEFYSPGLNSGLKSQNFSFSENMEEEEKGQTQKHY